MIRLGPAAAVLVAASVCSAAAHADPPEPGPAQAVPEPAEEDAPPPIEIPPPLEMPAPIELAPPVELPPPAPPPRFPQHFLFGNGLSLILTRLSVGYEFLPVAHHSVGFSIFGQYGGGIASELIGMKGAFVGVGAEVGYRFYAWRDGPFGPFFGLSFIGGYWHTQSSIFRIDPNAFRYFQYGPAADFGWSVHLDRTTVLAISLGAQYTFTDVDPRRLPELTRLLVGDGPRPRGGIQVGKTF
jgi:hypothetical protein